MSPWCQASEPRLAMASAKVSSSGSRKPRRAAVLSMRPMTSARRARPRTGRSRSARRPLSSVRVPVPVPDLRSGSRTRIRPTPPPPFGHGHGHGHTYGERADPHCLTDVSPAASPSSQSTLGRATPYAPATRTLATRSAGRRPRSTLPTGARKVASHRTTRTRSTGRSRSARAPGPGHPGSDACGS